MGNGRSLLLLLVFNGCGGLVSPTPGEEVDMSTPTDLVAPADLVPGVVTLRPCSGGDDCLPTGGQNLQVRDQTEDNATAVTVRLQPGQKVITEALTFEACSAQPVGIYYRKLVQNDANVPHFNDQGWATIETNFVPSLGVNKLPLVTTVQANEHLLVSLVLLKGSMLVADATCVWAFKAKKVDTQHVPPFNYIDNCPAADGGAPTCTIKPRQGWGGNFALTHPLVSVTARPL